jgi:Ca-activated chloride channel homolog
VTLEDIQVLDWRRDHPILKNLAMGKLYVAEALKMDVPLDSEVLIDGLKCPLVALHREGKGTHLVVAFDLLQSNWPLKVSFPIFLNQALQFMAVGGEMALRQSYEPGATPTVPRSLIQRAGSDVKQLTLKGPDGTQVKPIPASGDVALPALEHVGVYTTEPPVPPYDRMAVNLLDPVESNTFPAANVPGGAAEVREGTGAKSRMELWWWIVACAALPLLLIEWWVYTRRVHL